MRRTPLRASRNPAQSSSREFPNGVMQTRPLTTSRSRRAFRLQFKATEKSYTAAVKSGVFRADKTIERPVMDILPVDNLTRPIESTRHQDREQPQRRQPPRKREKVEPAAPLYTADGHLEQDQVSKIDVVA